MGKCLVFQKEPLVSPALLLFLLITKFTSFFLQKHRHLLELGSVVGRQAASWPDLLTLQRLGPCPALAPVPQQLQAGQGPAPGPLASEFPWDVLALMVKSVSLFSVPVCPRGLKMSPHSIPLLSSHLPFRLGRVANWVYCLNTPSI